MYPRLLLSMFRMALSASFNFPSPSISYFSAVEESLRSGGGGVVDASLLFVDGMDDSISIVVAIVEDSGSF